MMSKRTIVNPGSIFKWGLPCFVVAYIDEKTDHPKIFFITHKDIVWTNLDAEWDPGSTLKDDPIFWRDDT